MSDADTNEEELTLDKSTGGGGRSEDGPSGENSHSDGEEEESSAGDSGSFRHEEVDPVDKLVRALRDNDKRIRTIDLADLSEGLDEMGEYDEEEVCQAKLDKDVIKIFEALAANATVRTVKLRLFLENLDCTIGEDASRAIGNALAKSKSITHLMIAGPAFGLNSVEHIIHGIVSSNTLKRLQLFGHETWAMSDLDAPTTVLDNAGTAVLSKMLCKNRSVEELELNTNAISWETSTEQLCKGLASNLSIKSITLFNNEWLEAYEIDQICRSVENKATVNIGVDLTESLPLVIRHCRNIGEIRIRITDEEVELHVWERLSSAFQHNQFISSVVFDSAYSAPEMEKDTLVELAKCVVLGSVENLTMRNMPLDDAELTAMLEVFSTPNSCQYFKYSNLRTTSKTLTAKGAQALANFLRKNTTLESIAFSSSDSGENDFGDDGTIEILQAILERNGKTKSLCLDSCKIGDRGAEAFIDILENDHVGLEELDISMNEFGFSVCKKFAECLKRGNSFLRKLSIGGPREGETHEAELEANSHLVKALAHNTTLKELNLPYIWRGYGGREPIETQLEIEKVLEAILRSNHTITYVNAVSDYLDDQLEANKEHPILASTIKNAPLSTYLVKNLAKSEIAHAIERAEDIAGIDGVFNLVRQMAGSIATRALSKKRGRGD